MEDSTSEFTQLLQQASAGDDAAQARLMEAAYDELRRLAGGMTRGSDVRQV